MASIKNLKSKSKGTLGIAGHLYLDGDYDRRQRAFMDTPPAKIVRPLRVLRARYQQALALWERSIVKGLPETPYPHAAEAAYRTGRFCAGVGKGHLLQRLVA